MGVDLHAWEAVPEESAARLEELVEYARKRLGSPGWRVVASTVKMRKILFEVEDDDEQLFIGKVSHSEKSKGAHAALTKLWNAGMRPPSRYTVTQPIGWFPERELLIQEKAPGVQLLDLLRAGEIEPFEQAAEWLKSLRATDVVAPAWRAEVSTVQRCRRELAECLPEERSRVERLCDEVEGAMAAAQPLVVSHGDFHPMNLYFSSDGRVTPIDLDTFSVRESAVDVAYCLAQTAIFGFHVFGSIAATREARDTFLRCAPEAPRERIEMHIRFTLLRSLHYDLCILKLENKDAVEPFLHAAEYGLDE
jgi:hypothetical protein